MYIKGEIYDIPFKRNFVYGISYKYIHMVICSLSVNIKIYRLVNYMFINVTL